MAEVAWRPTPEYVENANVTRFMRAHGIDSIDELRRRSVEDIEWFWDAVVKDMAIEFTTPYERVLDDSGGIPWTKWFVGGRVNLTYNCVDRHALADRADRLAVIGETEDGEVRTLTYAELKREVDRDRGRAARRSGSARATRWRSSCRWWSRRWSPPTRSPSSARSTCRSSPASRPPPSRRGSRTPSAKALITADGGLRRGSAGADEAGRRRGGRGGAVRAST